MSCCTTDKASFLKEKAANFKKMILGLQPDKETIELINNFKEETLITTILTYVVPIIASGNLSQTSHELMTHLTIPKGEEQATNVKIKAYFIMFNDVVLA